MSISYRAKQGMYWGRMGVSLEGERGGGSGGTGNVLLGGFFGGARTGGGTGDVLLGGFLGGGGRGGTGDVLLEGFLGGRGRG